MARSTGILCPKCNQYSEDDETCDVCGANLGRILARQSEDEFGFKATEEKLAAMEEYAPKKMNPLIIGLIAVGTIIAVWMNYDLYKVRQSMAEQRDRGAHERGEVPNASEDVEASATPGVEAAAVETAAVDNQASAIPATPKSAPSATTPAPTKPPTDQRTAEDVERARSEAKQLIRGMQDDVPEPARTR